MPVRSKIEALPQATYVGRSTVNISVLSQSMRLGVAFMGLIFTSGLMAQDIDERTGDRERYAASTSSQIVAVVSPVDDQAKVVYRTAAGEEDVIGFGDTVPGIPDLPDGVDPQNTGTAYGPVTGVGHPAINESGTLAIMVSLTSQNIEARYDDGAILVGTPGNLTVVAQTLQTVGEAVLCNLEPSPQINDSGQVFFAATLQVANLGTNSEADPLRCDEDGGEENGQAGNSTYTRSAKGVFRYTPGVGVEQLLEAQLDQSGDVVSTSDPRFVTEATNYSVIDAHLLAHSHNSVTSSGGAYVFAWFTSDPAFDGDADDSNQEFRTGILYVGDGAPQVVAITDRIPRNSDYTYYLENSLGDFGYIGKLAANSSGQVAFKTALSYRQLRSCPDFSVLGCIADSLPAQLYLYDPANGLSDDPVVASDDPVPGASGQTFNGIPPLHSINDEGAIAFTAGLNIAGNCDVTVNRDGADANSPPPAGTGNDNWAGYCRGVYRRAPDGTVTELARTTRAAVDGGLGASSQTSIDGIEFRFDEIGATAIMGHDSNKVYFTASEVIDPPEVAVGDPRFASPIYQPEPRHAADGRTGTLYRSGVFMWNAGSIERIVVEDDPVFLEDDSVWEDYTPVAARQAPSLWNRLAGVMGIQTAYAQQTPATILRVFIPQLEMRQHEGNSDFSVRAWIDIDDDGVADLDSMISSIEQAPAVPVPALSAYVIAVLGLIMMVLGMVMLRGRA